MRQAIPITREEWRVLWADLGLSGLVRLAHMSDEFDGLTREQTAEELVRRSMIAGYDPVSGFFGTYSEKENTFELVGK